MPSQNVEEYIEAIYRLGGAKEPVSTGDLATQLNVAAPSVTTMLKRLVRDGMVEHTPYHGIKLTEKGVEMAAALIRGHRLSERLLTDMIGLPWDEVHKVACQLEHVFTGELADKVYQALGEPETCPHGNPMSLEDIAELSRLSDLPEGASGSVSKVTDETQDFLRYLQEQGIRLSSIIKVVSRAPFGDVVNIEVDGIRCALGTEVASRIWLRKTEEE